MNLCLSLMWGLSLFIAACPVMADSPYYSKPRKYSRPHNVPESNWLPTVNISKFQAKCRQPPPEWMRRGVQKELMPFKERGISQSALAATFEQVAPFAYARYRIIDGRIYRWGDPGPFGFDAFFRTLARLADYPGVPDLPNIDFILGQKDGVPLNFDPPDYWMTPNFHDQAPILAFARGEETPYILCIPDAFTIAEWRDLSKSIFSTNKHYPWEQKIRQAFWRGQPNDFHRALPLDLVTSDYTQQPRYIICYLSTLYPDRVNAGFNAPGSAPSTLWNALQNLMKPGVLPKDHLPYAYLPALDGAMCTYPGLLWRLLSNSVVFKHPGGVQWFYEALKPYVHYIPVSYRLEDLLEKIEWARIHDTECREIANTATQFVLDNVMPEDMYRYQLVVFEEYAKHQTFNVRDFAGETERDSRWVRIR